VVIVLGLLVTLAILLSWLTPSGAQASVGAARGARVTTATALGTANARQVTVTPSPTAGGSSQATPTTAPTTTPIGAPTPTSSPGATPLATTTPAPTTTSVAPTATLQATATAGPTSTPLATATPRATATALPTPTPTPVPFAPNGQVTLTRASQLVSSTATLTACPGCADDSAAATTRSLRTDAATTAIGQTFGAIARTTAPSASLETFLFDCVRAPPRSGCVAPAGTRVTDLSGRGRDCVLTSDARAFPGGPTSAVCQLVVNGPYTRANGDFNYGVSVPVGCDAFRCGALEDQGTSRVGTFGGTTYFVPTDCRSWDNGMQTAINTLGPALQSILYSQGLPNDLIAQQPTSVSSIWCSPPGACGSFLNPGQQIPWSQWSGCASGSSWRLAYSAANAIAVVRQRVINAAPSGYVTDQATISVCASPTVAWGPDATSQQAGLSCNGSGTARFDWQQSMSDDLRQRVAGHTVAEATAIIAALPYVQTGVVPNSWSVTLPAGYTRLPTDWTTITIMVH
jgi:hypothetical protein